MPISSPGPMSLSIISFPLAPTCNSFTQPEMSSRTCRTESPWQKIACALSNFFSRAAETTSLQAAEEAPENNEERSARAAVWFTGELSPKLCPAGCASLTALSRSLQLPRQFTRLEKAGLTQGPAAEICKIRLFRQWLSPFT